MKGKKGSITVFLALVFGLLFSMVLTSLEAARIQGATAYVSMLAELAGDSFLASYYYPVFEEYRLFGVHAGEEAGYFSTDVVEERLEENIIYGVDGLEGGLIGLVQPEISLEQYETLLTGNGSGFLAQVREQALLDGLSLTISEVFSEEMFTEAAVAGRIFQKQEETMAEITPAVMELLQLMELTDGILMGNSGLELDGNGRLQCAEAFVKQIVPIEPEELEGCFENQEVFEAMEEKLFRADELAAVVYSQTEEAYELEETIEELENRLEEYEESQSEWRVEIASLNEERREAAVAGDMEWASRCTAEIRDLRDRINTVDNLYRMVTGRRAAKIREKNRLMERISANYETLEQKLRAVQRVLDTAGEVLDRLEVKQETARLSVEAYEIFLEGMEASLSEELLQVFEGELDTMKAYAGMTEQGYVVSEMRESVEQNRMLLEEAELGGFSEEELLRVMREMELVEQCMQEYTTEHLWFTYGTITVTESTGENVAGVLQELLAQGILELAGIPEEEVSDRELTGQELPSAALEEEGLLDSLQNCMEAISRTFQAEDIGTLLRNAVEPAVTATALELYCIKYFHCYGEEAPYTKLNYEREYLLSGKKEDKANLLYMVLRLLAVRTLFCIVMILKNPEKMSVLQSFAAGVAGFTGIPVLAAAAKYALLLLWAVEEAFVEVAAMLEGKKIAVLGSGGVISFGEIFTFQKADVTQKAGAFPETVSGAGYEEYLNLLSLLVPVRKKAYRTMDLIQENIRNRYLDSFRMRNMVIRICFQTEVELEEKFRTGIFPETVYKLQWQEECSY
ncbi:MAG: hypothetical protein J6J42_13570 [Lachnospiraceae bacterium]|nr:hypothetical protein [Lachnospiraceae bacterium]